MKMWLAGFAMCQSMFCAIPFPWNVWEEKARDRMLVCLPFVGLEIGLLWYAIAFLVTMLKLPVLLTGAVIAFWPWLATGYIHLDGFMDVTDAVKSYRSLERRREILKDSHVGSFAVIGIGLLMIAQFAAAASVAVGDTSLGILMLIPVVSRCCSALSVIILPPMTTSQYANRQKTPLNISIVVIVLIASVAAGFVFWGRLGAVLVGEAAGYALALFRAYRSLEGMNGDVAGYSLSFAEFAALAVMALL